MVLQTVLMAVSCKFPFRKKKIIMFLVILRFILTHFIVRGSYSYLESKTSTQDNFYLIYQIQIASKLIYK